MSIYSILSSKPHNAHYLNRYIKFIQKCIKLNLTKNIIKHHICPKAKDMFPKFSSFKENSWNLAKLTERQHYIAHWMLSKIYNNKSTVGAFFYMCNINNKYVSSITYESLKKKYKISITGSNSHLYGKKNSEETLMKRRNYKGKKHHSYGTHHSTETKLKMSIATMGENNPMYNKPSAMLGKYHTEEAKEKMRITKLGENNHFYNKHHTKEAKEKMRGPRCPNKNLKKIIICPHCGKKGAHNLMNRWHFDKCKFKILQQ